MTLKVEYQDTATLIPYVNNARQHTVTQLKKLASAIQEFGFIVPVLRNSKGVILAGHGRIEAAEMCGLKQVPVIEVEHLTKAQQKAFVIADNRLAELAGWDKELLNIELEGLMVEDYDLKAAGIEDLLPKDNGPGEGEDGESGIAEYKYQLVIDCESEDDQAGLMERLEGEGRKCQPLIL